MPNLLALRFNSLFGKEVNYSRPKNQIDPNLLAKAISLHESGGRQVEGASGEFGSFQFMPGTWTQICKQVMGEVVPQTLENEQFVAQRKIVQLVQRFGNIQDVAKVWNTSLGGKEEPLSVKGVNKKGVKYDSVAYAKKVQAVYDSLNKSRATTTSENQVAVAAGAIPQKSLHYIRPNEDGTPGTPQLGGLLSQRLKNLSTPSIDGLTKLKEALLPTPQSEEEAKSRGLIPIKGPFSGQPMYIDPTGVGGTMKRVASSLGEQVLYHGTNDIGWHLRGEAIRRSETSFLGHGGVFFTTSAKDATNWISASRGYVQTKARNAVGGLLRLSKKDSSSFNLKKISQHDYEKMQHEAFDELYANPQKFNTDKYGVHESRAWSIVEERLRAEGYEGVDFGGSGVLFNPENISTKLVKELPLK